MRRSSVLFVLIPLLLCSCPEEEEEREWERRADEENFGCRSCSPISTLADENCPIGYECNADWRLTSNVLSPTECGCSELKCADRNATLSVNGEKVGKIRCRAQEWTLAHDPSITTTSAVCAKSCGQRVCKRSHPVPPRDLYSQLDVKDPGQEEYCARAECPKGIAIFTDEGQLDYSLPSTHLVCSSSGKWKIGEEEEEYAMCHEKCLCNVLYGVLGDGSEGACPPNTLCVPPTSGDECEQKCPADSSPMYVDATGTALSSRDIKCVGDDWIVTGSKDVTCAYKEGAGEAATPSGSCTALRKGPCPRKPAVCDFNQTKFKTTAGDIMVLDCNSVGSWLHHGQDVYAANCQTDQSVVQSCLDQMQGGASSVNYLCKLGACTLTCLDSKQFQYDLPGGTPGLTSKIVKCYKSRLTSVSLQEIENVKCI